MDLDLRDPSEITSLPDLKDDNDDVIVGNDHEKHYEDVIVPNNDMENTNGKIMENNGKMEKISANVIAVKEYSLDREDEDDLVFVPTVNGEGGVAS